jgi:hypothetical protein
METAMTKLRAFRGWKESKRVSVVAVYEDASTGARVHEFCRSLSRQLGENCELTHQVWLVNEFWMPQLKEIAAREAASADLIIISLHQADSLSDAVKGWFDLWLPQKGNCHMALVALLDHLDQGDSNAMRAYLEKSAQRSEMEFLAQSEEMPEFC